MSGRPDNIQKSESESRGRLEHEEIHELWDSILDILLERVSYKSITIVELRHVVDELELLLRAARGRADVWSSVIDVALLLFKGDGTVRDFKARLTYNESTIYRALTRLELSGFAVRADSGGPSGQWTINRQRCPVLYRASRF